MQLDLDKVIQKVQPLSLESLEKHFQVVILGPLTQKKQRSIVSGKMAFRPKIVLELLKWRKQVNPHTFQEHRNFNGDH